MGYMVRVINGNGITFWLGRRRIYVIRSIDVGAKATRLRGKQKKIECVQHSKSSRETIN